MMGRSHLMIGACALEHAYVASELINRTGLAPLMIIRDLTQTHLGLIEPSTAVMVTYVGAYFLGTLLPDIDNPNSVLGRIIHVPVEHRTWLHAIYLYLIFAILGWHYPIFMWLFLGVIVHLFWDSFSASGNCWFYKLLSDYRKYPSGAKIKKGHKLKLYHTGKWSEYLLLFIIVVITVASFIWIKR